MFFPPRSSPQGYNHSGKSGEVDFLVGTMGLANAQRLLNYIRIFTEFFSQPEWNNLIVIFGVLNEPLMVVIGEDQLKALYASHFFQSRLYFVINPY